MDDQELRNLAVSVRCRIEREVDPIEPMSVVPTHGATGRLRWPLLLGAVAGIVALVVAFAVVGSRGNDSIETATASSLASVAPSTVLSETTVALPSVVSSTVVAPVATSPEVRPGPVGDLCVGPPPDAFEDIGAFHTIPPSPSADNLLVAVASIGTPACPGDQFDIVVDVTNIGPAPATFESDLGVLFGSGANKWSAGRITLQQLAPGESAQQVVRIMVPALRPGRYELLVGGHSLQAPVTIEVAATVGGSDIADESITRPYVDESICAPLAARQTATPGSSITLNPFALGWEAPLAMQILGDPELGVSGNFALVERFFTTDFTATDSTRFDDAVVDANDTRAVYSVGDSGYGSVFLLFIDGTQAYLRGRGFDLAELERIVAALTPRTGDDAATGFDYDPSVGPPDVEVLHEGTNLDHQISYAYLECQLVGGSGGYRIGAVTGDPIAEYVAAMDRPYPLEVGRRGDSVIIVGYFGREPAGPDAIRADQVRNADIDVWNRLLEQPDSHERNETP